MGIRTDLVTERREMQTAEVSGATTEKYERDGITVEKITVQTEEAAARLQKPTGKYMTLSFGDLQNLCRPEPLEDAIIYALTELLPSRENVLIVGLGNRRITPDALGPLTADRLLVTRHIGKEFTEQYGLPPLCPVSALTPNVIGKTGIETLEIIRGTVERTKPAAMIVLDALAARRPERLCRTLQLSDSGITPGSGVHNRRQEISAKILGIPVIAVGIPTVADIGSVVYDLTGKETDIPERDMMITPKDIDLMIDRAAALLADALNRFLQPHLDRETLRCLA